MNKEKIKVSCAHADHSISIFLIGTLLLTLLGLSVLEVDWLKLFSRIPEIGTIFYRLAMLNFQNIDLVWSAFLETVAITILSTFYSVFLGLLFGLLGAENILGHRIFSSVIKSFFTFLRAVPTPVWVLLMLVCLGFGPSAGIAGLCVHTTAFFTRSFSQSFEDVSNDTLEALKACGASPLVIFFRAMLPSAMTQLVAWLGMRFEINFSECAILGMVGAGGIGYVISTSIQGYDYGTAGLAILFVFIFAVSLERIFVIIKRKIK